MQRFLSNKILYTTLLLFFPALILMSWFNVILNNFSFNTVNYIIAYILPSLVFSYVVAFMTADLLDDAYHYTLPRILFTFAGLVGFLFLFSSLFRLVGYQSIFVTLLFPSVLGASTQTTDAEDQAMRFYSLEITGALVVLAALFAVASFIFKTQPRMKRSYLAANEIVEEEDLRPKKEKVPKHNAVKKKKSVSVKKKKKARTGKRSISKKSRRKR